MARSGRRYGAVLTVAAVCWGGCAVAGAGAEKRTGNLAPNPGFEQGKGGKPAGWSAPDDLTVFWEEGGVRGKCFRLDTDVYRSEWEKFRHDPQPGRKKTPTQGNKYDTVGGSCGVAVYSHPIAVEEDAWYLVEYDIKSGGGEPFVYLKGYNRCDEAAAARSGELIFFRPQPGGPRFSLMVKGTVGDGRHQPQAGDYLMTYRKRFVARTPSGRWYHVEGVAHLQRRHHVDAVLLELYACWPAAEYEFDNVSMRQVTAAAAKAMQAHRRRGPTPVPGVSER